MKIAVVSSVYGGYDRPVPPPDQTMPAEWVLVSDREYDVEPWRCVIEPRSLEDPRMASKVAKMHPELYADADAYIWIDTSFQILGHDFIGWCVSHLDRGDLAMISHPDRTRILDEARVLQPRWPLAVDQAEHYIAAGFPDGWGLWMTGLMVSRAPLPFADAWLRELVRWTPRDQVSLPPLLYAAGIRPVDMRPGRHHLNQYFHVRGHGG